MENILKRIELSYLNLCINTILLSLGPQDLFGLFVPHYHAFNNKKRFVDYVDTVDKNATSLLGDNLLDVYSRMKLSGRLSPRSNIAFLSTVST